MKGKLCNIVSFLNLNYIPYDTHSVLAFVLIELFTIMVHIKGSHIMFVTNHIYPTKERSTRSTLHWGKEAHNEFPKV